MLGAGVDELVGAEVGELGNVMRLASDVLRDVMASALGAPRCPEYPLPVMS